MARGRSTLDPNARAARFRDAPVETFHPQSGMVSVVATIEKHLFAAPLDTLIKNLNFTISQTDPPTESPQTTISIKFKFADGLEIKFPTRDIFDGLNSYLIPRELAKVLNGTEILILVSKTIDVTYAFDMRGE